MGFNKRYVNFSSILCWHKNGGSQEIIRNLNSAKVDAFIIETGTTEKIFEIAQNPNKSTQSKVFEIDQLI